MPAADTPPPACWALKRNCSLAPRPAVLLLLAAPGAVLGAVALGAGLLGYTPIVAFAVLALASLGAALVAYARHAGDGEVVTLRGDVLCVDQHEAGAVRHIELPTAWLRVAEAPQGGHVELAQGRRRVAVGAHVAANERAAFVHGLRRSIAQLR